MKELNDFSVNILDYDKLIPLTEHSIVGYYSIYPDGRFNYVSPEVLHMFGYTSEEMKTVTIFDLLHPNDASIMEENMRKRVQNGISEIFYKVKGVGKSSKIFELDIHSHIIPQENEQSLFLGIILDITEQRGTRDELRKMNQNLNSLISASPLALITLNMNGNVELWNPAAEKIFGWKAEEVINKPLPTIPEEEQDSWNQLFQYILQGNHLTNQENIRKKKDGSLIDVSISTAPIYNNVGIVNGYIAIVTDISEQKRKETEIAKALKELRDLKHALDSAATVSITDVNEKIIYVNDKFCEVSGFSREELIGRPYSIIKSDYHSEEFFDQVRSTIQSGQTWKGEVLNKSKDGSNWWSDITVIPFLNNNGEPHQYIYICSDITERKIMEGAIKRQREKLRQREARFRSLVQNSHEMICILDREGRFHYMNPTAEKNSGYSLGELRGKSIFELIHPNELNAVKEEFDGFLFKPGESLKNLYRLKHANGSWIYCELNLTNLYHEDSINGIVCNLRDVTENKRAEEQIKHMAYYDHLTGLPNRRHFEEDLTKEFEKAKNANTLLSVMFLDLDGFKYINDSLGHDVGDKLLRETALRLNNHFFNHASVSRMGGDEFTIIVSDFDDIDYISEISEQVLKLFDKPFIIDNHEISVTTSIGVSIYPYNGESVQELVKKADLAMYSAKEQGKSKYQIFTSNQY